MSTGRGSRVGSDPWYAAEEVRLLAFPLRVIGTAGGAAPLDARGSDTGDPSAAYATARMAFAQALGVLRGHEGHEEAARALLESLLRIGPTGWTDSPEPGSVRSLYALDHVILAAATGVAAEVDPARDLLQAALEELDRGFWDAASDRPIDHLTSSGDAAPYRGMNSAMHLTEALFAAWAATDDPRHRDRAIGLCRLAVEKAAARSMRLCEHYDAEWRALPEYGRDDPDHAFRPYGSTPGHGFEWSRLIGQAVGLPGTDGFAAAAAALYDRAAGDGWSRIPAPGLIYTVDWDGAVVSTRRLSWVAAEALSAASVLSRIGAPTDRAGDDIATWTALIRSEFVDTVRGSWIEDLDRPDGRKPDLYHNLQSMLIPQLPVGTSLIKAIRDS